MNWLVKIFNWGLATVILFIVFSNFWIISVSKNQIFDTIDNLPQLDTAIVFGTTKSRTGGGMNPFFENRMNAAAELYHGNKIKTLILSGSKELKYYDETNDMKIALIKLGVQSKDIMLDTLGIRTLDTVWRGKYIYGATSAILVTQEFHAYRAIYISNSMGLNAICFAAKFPDSSSFFKTRVREILARPKAVLDLLFWA
jgi:SanA protein